MKITLTRKTILAILLGILPLSHAHGMDENEKIQLYGMFFQCMEEKRLAQPGQPAAKDIPFFKELEYAKALTLTNQHVEAAKAWDNILGLAPSEKRVDMCRDIIADLNRSAA